MSRQASQPLARLGSKRGLISGWTPGSGDWRPHRLWLLTAGTVTPVISSQESRLRHPLAARKQFLRLALSDAS
jgi:hypothetical protein